MVLTVDKKTKNKETEDSRFSNCIYPLVRLGDVAGSPFYKNDNTFRLELENVEVVKRPKDFSMERVNEGVVVGKNWPGINKCNFVCVMSEVNNGEKGYSVKDVVLQVLNPKKKKYTCPEILRTYEI